MKRTKNGLENEMENKNINLIKTIMSKDKYYYRYSLSIMNTFTRSDNIFLEQHSLN